MQTFFIAVSALGTSFILLSVFTTWVTGSTARKRSRSVSETSSGSESEWEEEVPYTSQYPLEDATDSKHVRGKLDSYFIIENTPREIVIMMYDSSRESFVYWADTSSAAYDVLETVARKFVTVYGCKGIYLERQRPKDRRKAEQDCSGSTQEEENDSSENPDADVFVKKRKRADTSKAAAALRANSYLRLGKLHDFKPVEKNEEQLDFKTFMANNPLLS